MLTIYRSNRAELLADLLATQLRLNPPDPFEQVAVLVNTWPTSRWLGERLAIGLGGIAANLRFPFPGSKLRQVVDRLLEEDEAGIRQRAVGETPVFPDPWRAERLVWPVLDLLPTIASGQDGEPLRRWLADRDLEHRLDHASWQLGRSIADAFDDYALYRPGMLRSWEQGDPADGSSEPVPADQLWQPRLYRALRQRLSRAPFGLRVAEAVELLRTSAPPADRLPGPLRLFGLSSLAPVQVQLLQALSGHVPVDLYLLTPCRDLWQRCRDRRRELSDVLALAQPLEADWLLHTPGLEARFGRLGAEFQQLLEGTGEYQLGSSDEHDLFFAPATASRTASPSASLLTQLQEQLADPNRIRALTRDPHDDSVAFHPCPGQVRQVQIVRDQILQLLAADPSLEPRDILVMTPRIDVLAPLVASVFGDSGATGVDLPWRLTDRSQQSDAGVGRTVLQLLRLAGERLTATALETLLECPPLQQRFGLSGEDTARLNEVLQQCGFRWGLDGEERGGDPTHSLGWAIDRLLLGLVLPCRPGLAPGETAPFATGASLDLQGRWLHLLTRLRHWLHILRHGCGVREWGERLPPLLADLFDEAGEQAWEIPTLLAALDDWLQASADFIPALEGPVVADVLEERLTAESGRFGHRSGALTISALEPMRAIPHRVIVLMGLDAGVFPRQRPRSGFHRMERQRKLGDPHPTDQDRYVLMEALLSARDHLLVTWSCRDERSGEPLPPPTPVRQWIDWLQGELGEQARGLERQHSASPLDRRNFQGQGPWLPASCDRRQLQSRRELDSGTLTPPPPLLRAAMPSQPPTSDLTPFEDLREWLMQPQRHWLRQLGLHPVEWQEGIDDLEPLELGELERAQLLRQVFDASVDGEPDGPEGWLLRTRGQGLLPQGAAATLEARSLHARWSSLDHCLRALGPPSRSAVAWGDWQAAPLRRGDAVVIAHTARAGAGQRLDLWLHLLLAAAAGGGEAGPPRRGALVARDRDDFSMVLELPAPDPLDACRQLERLAELRQRWRTACWPVPPRTGWAYAEAEGRRPGSGWDKAAQAWEGGFGAPGERDRPDMALCFGAGLPAAELLDERFAELALALFEPLQEASA